MPESGLVFTSLLSGQVKPRQSVRAALKSQLCNDEF